jgi:hypothetical protein
MNLPLDTVVTGIPSMEVLEQDLLAAYSFRPLTAQQVSTLLESTRQVGKDGKHEGYKRG